jgi:hypothetical protein
MSNYKTITKVQKVAEKLQELVDKKIQSFTLEDVAREDYEIFDYFVKRSYEVHLCYAKKKFPKNTFLKEKYTGFITLRNNE